MEIITFFSLFFKNWKSGRRATKVQIFLLVYPGIELGKYQPQAPVVQRADNFIQRINRYPADKM